MSCHFVPYVQKLFRTNYIKLVNNSCTYSMHVDFVPSHLLRRVCYYLVVKSTKINRIFKNVLDKTTQSATPLNSILELPKESGGPWSMHGFPDFCNYDKHPEPGKIQIIIRINSFLPGNAALIANEYIFISSSIFKTTAIMSSVSQNILFGFSNP